MKEVDPSEFTFRGWEKFLNDEIPKYKKFYADWMKTDLIENKKVICFEYLELNPLEVMTGTDQGIQA